MILRALLAAAMVAVPLAAGGCSKPAAGAPEDFAKEFQGTWQSVAPTKKEHAAMIKFEGDTFFFVDQGPASAGGPRGEQGQYNVNSQAQPKTIDLIVTTGPHAGELRLGLYEFEGPRLRICLAGHAEPRPTDFRATGKNVLLHLELKPPVPVAPNPPGAQQK